MIRKKLSTQKSKGETQNTLGYGLKKSILIDSNRLQTGTTQEFIEFLAKKLIGLVKESRKIPASTKWYRLTHLTKSHPNKPLP